MNDCHLIRISTYIFLYFLVSLYFSSSLLCFAELVSSFPPTGSLSSVFLFLPSSAFFKAMLIPSCPFLLVGSLPISHAGNSKQQAPAGRALCDSQLPHVNGYLIKPFVSHIQEQDNNVVVDWLSSLVWELRLAQLTKSFFMHLDIKDWEIWEYGSLWLFFVSPGPIMPQVILKNSSGLWLGFWSCFSLRTQSLWLIKAKYTHTFLGGNSPYMTHLLLRKIPYCCLPFFNPVIVMFTHGVDWNFTGFYLYMGSLILSLILLFYQTCSLCHALPLLFVCTSFVPYLSSLSPSFSWSSSPYPHYFPSVDFSSFSS